MPLHFDRLAEWYNYIEVALWPSLGVLIAIHGLRNRGVIRHDCLVAAAVLGVFGISDWFEATTGNEWWHPWWLLLWKATCVAALLVLIYRGYRRRRTVNMQIANE